MRDSNELINRIRYMFEYMTLCADPTLFDLTSPVRPSPVPNGVPMGIVALPDFVVDVAIDGIRNATAAKRGQIEPLDVGGRVGRLARVLQEFGGQRNGWYNVKYVAKSGDVGRVVLHRQFVKPQNRSPNFEPLSLQYIIDSKEDHDWLHVYGTTGERIESSYEGLDVTVADIDESPYSITDLFADARYIVIASKHAHHAISAVSVIAEGLDRLSKSLPEEFSKDPDLRIPIGILVDLSALWNPDDAGRVVESFSELNKQASAFDIDSTALCDHTLGFAQEHFKQILIRDAGILRLGDQSQPLPDFISHPITREALTAGYVLASACSLGWELLRRWYYYFPKMRPIDSNPHDSFPRAAEGQVNPSQLQRGLLPSLAMGAGPPIDPSDRIQFAALLAHVTKSRPMSYWDLIKIETVPQFKDWEDGPMIALGSGSEDRLAELEQRALLSSHLVPRFKDSGNKETLSLHLPTSELQVFESSCFLRDARREAKKTEKEKTSEEINKAVMFDLDSTLVDSGGLLRACWFNGLRALFREAKVRVNSEGIQTIIDIYQTFVYKNYDRFRLLLREHPDIPPEWQPCDFRQVWNHPYAWAALLWILDLTKSGLSQSKAGGWEHSLWRQTLETHSNHRGAGRCLCHVCKNLEPRLKKADDPEVRNRREVTLPLRDLLIRFRFEIQAGRTAFWEVNYPCFPQARSCVQMLRATPGCEVYIVTEGHEETQLQKLKCCGLDDLFPRGRVLSTGAASAAEVASIDLSKLFHSNMVWASALKEAEVVIRQEASADLDPLRQKRDATFAFITFLTDLLSVLYFKAQKQFYCAVIDAICLKPESPAQMLQSFLEKRIADYQVGRGRPIKFFMIGDRYDNDCKPLLDIGLSGGGRVGVGTCRLLSGKRAKEYCPPMSEDPEFPAKPTMYVCDTLVQVAHILHGRDVWDRIEPMDVAPPVLLEPKEGVIFYRFAKVDDTRKDEKTFEKLASRFKDLSWAREHDDFQKEPAVRDMLGQIERDLAVCDIVSLAGFFDSMKADMQMWWSQANKYGSMGSTQESAISLLKGSLKILTEVNAWRHRLGRPLLGRREKADDTLEWALGSNLLTCISLPTLIVGSDVLEQADGKCPAGIDARMVLDAIPYSHEGIEIVESLAKELRSEIFWNTEEWLKKARSL
jgi:FMN phosphatase YigB (HAD superfamily)